VGKRAIRPVLYGGPVPVRLEKNEGYNPRALRRLRELTVKHEQQILERWHEHLGKP
jgi:hypothetical protein